MAFGPIQPLSFGSSRPTSYFSSSSFKPYKFDFGEPEGERRSHSGVLGFFQNLIGDVGKTVTGIPEGFKQTFTHPIRTAEGIGESYSAMYGPLFHGDFEKFGRNLYDHPLGPILDAIAIATVPFTGGASLAIRGGSVVGRVGRALESSALVNLGDRSIAFGGKLAKPAELTFRSPAARAGEAGAPEFTTLGRNMSPVGRVVARKIHAVRQSLPENTPVLGESIRFGKLESGRLRGEAKAYLRHEVPFVKAVRKLKPAEKAALTFRARATEPLTYKRLLEEGEIDGNVIEPSMLKTLEKRGDEINRLFYQPTKRMEEAEKLGRSLADADADLKIQYGWMSPEEAVDAPYQWVRIMSGARYLGEHAVNGRLRKIEKELHRLDVRQSGVTKNIERLAEGTPALKAAGREADRMANHMSREAARRQRLAREAEGIERTRAEIERLKADLETVSTGGPIPDIDARLAAGGNDAYDALVRSGVRVTKDLEKARIRAMGRLYDRLTALQGKYDKQAAAYVGLQRRFEQAAIDAEKQGAQGAEIFAARKERVDLLRNEESALADIQRERQQLWKEKEKYSEGAGLYGGKSIEEIRQELADGNLAEPFYMPDAVQRKVASLTGGRSVPTNPVKVNKGIRQLMGSLALDPELLSAEYAHTIMKAYQADVHDLLIASGKWVDVTEGIPRGYTYIRRKDEVGNVINDDRAVLEEGMAEFLSAEDIADLVATRAAGEAMVRDGKRLVAPERMVKALAGDYRRGHNALTKMLWDRPTSLWRRIILGLSPRFFVNNVVGNHFLYALGFAGIDGLRAYLNSVWDAKGPAAVRSMLKDSANPASIRDQFMMEFFPDQVFGTFGRTQSKAADRFTPLTGKLGKDKRVKKAREAVGKWSLGVLPVTQSFAEGFVRKAAVESALRSSVEFKRAAINMPKQLREFEDVARKALEDNPKLAHKVSMQINDALGDYFSMSAMERHFWRQLFPFYAWYRAIARVAFRLPARHPGRAVALAQLGYVGVEDTMEKLGEIPSFLWGAVPVSQGFLEFFGLDPDKSRVPILTTQGLNPFATIKDEADALSSLFTGEFDPGREIGSGLNPVGAGLIESLTGRDLFSGAPIENRGPGGLLPNIAFNFVEGLPPMQLANAATGGLTQGTAEKPTLYDNTFERVMANFLGLPVRQLNKKKAQAMYKDEFFLPKEKKKTPEYTFKIPKLTSSGFN